MNEYNMLYMNPADTEQIPLFQSMLEYAYETMQRDGSFAKVFHGGTVTTAQDMIAHILRAGTVAIAAFDSKGEMAAIAWLNSIEGRSARGHFVFFKKYWGRKMSVPLGRAIFAYLLGLKDAGGYLFDVLVGITPKNNPLAWRRSLECGAHLVGTIPKFFHMAETGDSMDAVAVVVTRESMGM